ncbi:hypothetical protein NDU88_000782 [Pleurodeles waltl]|uniref:Uncharacterized protein n=1 Tax=Pleurodeles waltl TaxID=8319 RepID=A0AAV7MHT7_PLEWA|nr:hypothetical protein NDU88_000782 [Pleurodeles waltl]
MDGVPLTSVIVTSILEALSSNLFNLQSVLQKSININIIINTLHKNSALMRNAELARDKNPAIARSGARRPKDQGTELSRSGGRRPMDQGTELSHPMDQGTELSRSGARHPMDHLFPPGARARRKARGRAVERGRGDYCRNLRITPWARDFVCGLICKRNLKLGGGGSGYPGDDISARPRAALQHTVYPRSLHNLA